MYKFTEVVYSPEVWSDVSGRVKAYDADVPRELFDAMLERAARHKGYSASSQDLHVYRNDNATMEFVGSSSSSSSSGSSGSGSSSSSSGGRVWRSTLIGEREIPGTFLVERTFMRSAPLPLYMFSCAQHNGVYLKVRRIVLRVHKCARLIFEVASAPGAGEGGDAMAFSRRVRVEITGDQDSDSADIKRTVENTIQVVILGQQPKRVIFRSSR